MKRIGNLGFGKVKHEGVVKDAVFLFGQGENCTCADCPVLYGGECYTTEANNAALHAPEVKDGEL